MAGGADGEMIQVYYMGPGLDGWYPGCWLAVGDCIYVTGYRVIQDSVRMHTCAYLCMVVRHVCRVDTRCETLL